MYCISNVIRRSNISYSNWFGLLPVSEQVSSAVFHSFVLLDDLHLQVDHLLLDSSILALHNVTEGPPFTFDVVDVEPRWRELESLLLQQTLSITEQLQVKEVRI